MRREKKSIKEVRGERKMNKKIINHMPLGFVPCQNCKDIVQCCKSLTHLKHLIKLHFWCLVCQMCYITAFSTDTISAVNALTVYNVAVYYYFINFFSLISLSSHSFTLISLSLPYPSLFNVKKKMKTNHQHHHCNPAPPTSATKTHFNG